jgi:HD-GYP domain-containing protein (c-di-GMP phosphodiesterase class II)
MTIPAHINRQCEDLSSLLGETCLPCLWDVEEGGINKQMAAIYQSAFQEDAESTLATMTEAGKAMKTKIAALPTGRVAFAVPLQHNGSRHWFAIGRAWSSDREMFQKLFHAATEASKRKYQLEQQQTSLETAEVNIRQTIQERNWIRELSSYAQDRSRTSTSALTSRVLTQLVQMIHADAIGVVPNHNEERREITIRPTTYGSPIWKNDDFQQLLGMIGEIKNGDFIVQNDRSYQLPHGVCTACVIVQIGTAVPLGHLIAINRRIDRKTPLRRSSDINFTAADASMLNEAAAFFESEAVQRHMMGESERLIIGTLRSMSSAIEARDPYTRGHSERVARLSYMLAKKLDVSHEKCREIYVSGVLHDVGKIGIPDQVLLKPGRLEPEEIAIIQKHPEIGHHILSDMKRLEFALPGVLYHHERWDGKGYPHQLGGEDTPLMARVLAVADSFDAMTSSRPYRSAMVVERACSILADGAGAQWDPNVCKAFENWRQEHTIRGTDEDPMGLLSEELDFQRNHVVQFV